MDHQPTYFMDHGTTNNMDVDSIQGQDDTSRENLVHYISSDYETEILRTPTRIVTSDDDDQYYHQQQPNRPSFERRKSYESAGSSSTGSLFDGINQIRDFVLASFSDGYYHGSSCSSSYESKQVNSENISVDSSYDNRSTSIYSLSDRSKSAYPCVPVTPPHHTTGSNNLMGMGRDIGTPARRPLAVAVGFKYAEDRDGRPIVITPRKQKRRFECHTPPTSYTNHHDTIMIRPALTASTHSNTSSFSGASTSTGITTTTTTTKLRILPRLPMMPDPDSLDL